MSQTTLIPNIFKLGCVYQYLEFCYICCNFSIMSSDNKDIFLTVSSRDSVNRCLQIECIDLILPVYCKTTFNFRGQIHYLLLSQYCPFSWRNQSNWHQTSKPQSRAMLACRPQQIALCQSSLLQTQLLIEWDIILYSFVVVSTHTEGIPGNWAGRWEIKFPTIFRKQRIDLKSDEARDSQIPAFTFTPVMCFL